MPRHRTSRSLSVPAKIAERASCGPCNVTKWELQLGGHFDVSENEAPASKQPKVFSLIRDTSSLVICLSVEDVELSRDMSLPAETIMESMI